MVGPTPQKAAAASAGSATPALTPAQKRRLRKKKLDEAAANGTTPSKPAAPVAAAAAAAASSTPKAAAPAAAAAAGGASTKKKGKKLEETPAFVPADDSADDSDVGAESDEDTVHIITASNYGKKKSMAALSATQVLAYAEEQKRKEGLLGGSDDDEAPKKSAKKSAKTLMDSDDEEEPPKKKRKSTAGGDADSLTINKAFAKKFEDEKRKQALSKRGSRGDVMATLMREAANAGEGELDSDDELVGDLRAQIRAGGATRSTDDRPRALGDDESDESAESEDEDGDLLTTAIDGKIAATMDAIRKKQPEVYDSKKSFFTEEEIERIRVEKAAERAAGGAKKMNVTQLMAAQLLEKFDDEEDEDETLNSRGRLQKLADHSGRGLTYTEQQKKIKQDFLASAEKSSGDEDESDDDVFKVKTKAAALSDEDEDAPQPKKGKAERKAAARFTSNGQGVTSENSAEFLQSYLSGEWWREKDLTKLPSYRDIKGEDLPEDVSASEDEAALDDVDTFEAAYNFRFQEPGNAYQIKSYPRPQEIGDSLRKEDNKRKTARETAAKHKEEEKTRKKEEIARLKAEKRKDLTKKMKELEEIAGLKDTSNKINLQELLNNWDPSAHDKMMESLFNDEDYYGDLADEDMDEDALRALVLKGEDMASLGMGRLPDQKPSGASKKKKKLDPEAADAFAATSAAIARTVDEYRDLDTEALVGSKTTFKWKMVAPDSFGMSMEDIFNMEDKELNAKVSLKKLATYREDGDVDHAMPHKRKRDEKMARINSKQAKRDAWKKGHGTPAAGAASTSVKKEAPKPAAKPAAAPAADAGPLTASQKRRQRKKKLEELTTAEGGSGGEPSAKKQKTSDE